MADPITLSLLQTGGKAQLSRALAKIEAEPDAAETIALLSEAYGAPKGHVIGITGPPGTGKSSLLDVLIRAWREDGKTVACIAVDPSSKRSGGALLGDRLRLATDPEDQGVFVRSMAARDRLGGLASLTFPAMVLMRATHDIVIIETVGVGQSETDIAGIADTVVFCVQPGAGDMIQFMKAGIVEIPHLVVVTKADMGALASRARQDIISALHLSGNSNGADVPVLSVSSRDRIGVAELVEAIRRRWDSQLQAEDIGAIRARQAHCWLMESLRDRFGTRGLKRLSGRLETFAAGRNISPFVGLAEISAALDSP